MGKFEIISTTADVGIRVSGRDLADLFKSAVNGLNRLLFGAGMPPLSADAGAAVYHYAYRGDSAENILVNLLAEILFLYQVKGKITADIRIKKAGKNSIVADLFLIEAEIEPEMDIKSVTYHNLKIREENGEKSAEIILDI